MQFHSLLLNTKSPRWDFAAFRLPSPSGGTWRDFYCQVPTGGTCGGKQNIPGVSHGTHRRPIRCEVTWCPVPPMAFRLRTFRCFKWILMKREESFWRMGPINEKLMRKTSEKRDFTHRFFGCVPLNWAAIFKRENSPDQSRPSDPMWSVCVLAHIS